MIKEGISEAEIVANLRGEFIEDARRRVDLLIKNRNSAETAGDPTAAYTEFKQELHTLKGMGQSFGFGSVTMIARRLETYLVGGTPQSFAGDSAVVPFLSALDGIIDAGEEPSDDDIDEILGGLPAPVET